MSKQCVRCLMACVVLLMAVGQLDADSGKASLVSPRFIRASETDTVFKNPAELPLHDRITELRIGYGMTDQRFSGLFVAHIPDNIIETGRDIEGNSTYLGLGDFAYSIEFFGSNFGQNVFLQRESDGSRRFNLARGGYKMGFTWAKKTRFFTVGANVKTYRYRDLKSPDLNRNAVGLDLGVFLTPFTDLYLGAAMSDVGTTTIKDDNGNTVRNADNSLAVIEQEIRLTAAAISGNDMSFSVGIPLRLINELRDNPRQAWKTISFQGTKIFDNTFSVTAGSNTKDLYASLGLRLNDYLDVSAIGSRDLFNRNDVQLTLAVSAGIPMESFKSNMKKRNKHKNKLKKPMSRRQKQRQLSQQNRDEDDHEKRLNELEDDVDAEMRELKQKKRRIQKIKRRQRLERELEELEDEY